MDAVRLKAAIFGEMDGSEPQLLPGVTEPDLLRELVTTRHYEGFDGEVLSIRRRAKVLWEAERQQAKLLLMEVISTDLNPFGEELLTGFSETMDGDEAADFLTTNPKILEFIPIKPSVAKVSIARESYGAHSKLP